jgi:hypothetical protein
MNTTIKIKAYEAFFNQDGLIRLFSMKFDDGAIGNFKLLPKNKSSEEVVSFMQSFLVPFGISILGGELFYGDTVIDNLARELFQVWGNFVANNALDQYSLWSNSAYYEVTSGELVIAYPVRINFNG